MNCKLCHIPRSEDIGLCDEAKRSSVLLNLRKYTSVQSNSRVKGQGKRHVRYQAYQTDSR